MMIETVCETKWYDNDHRKEIPIPKGVKSEVLTKDMYYKIGSRDLRNTIYRARIMYKKRKQEGVFSLLGGKYRFLSKSEYKVL